MEIHIRIVNSNFLNNFFHVNMLKPLPTISSFRKYKEKKKKTKQSHTDDISSNHTDFPFLCTPFIPLLYSPLDKIERTNDTHSFIFFQKKILKKIKNMEESLSEIQNETFFYRYIQKTKYAKCFPEIYKIYDMGLLLEHKHWTVFNFIYENKKNTSQISLLPNILNKIEEKISVLHSRKKKVLSNLFFYDLKMEIFDHIHKIIKVYIDITPSMIHDIPIVHPHKIIEICKNKIVQYYTTIQEYEYSIIHGDLILSHILTNEIGDEIHFISPRGHFGNTKYFGIREFDISRLLFSLQGYDYILNSHNILSQPQKYIPHPSIISSLTSEMYETHFHKIHEIWSVIHWFRASSLFPENSSSSFLCYAYALYYGSII